MVRWFWKSDGEGDDQIELIQFEPSWRPIKPIGKQFDHHVISSPQKQNGIRNQHKQTDHITDQGAVGTN